MNWTEGNLARHSRGHAKNEVLKRQKQHFANARNRLLNGNVKQSPVKISFLSPDYVHHLRKEPEYALSPSTHLRSPALPSTDVGGHSRSTKQSFDPQADDAEETASIAVCLNTNPFSGARKRSALDAKADQENPRVYDKRRKLLRKPDWAGLEFQQPIELVFSGNKQASGGRPWRMIEQPSHGARLNLVQPMRTREIGQEELGVSPPALTQAGPANMKIQIGSQEKDPRRTSTSPLSPPTLSPNRLQAHQIGRAPQGRVTDASYMEACTSSTSSSMDYFQTRSMEARKGRNETSRYSREFPVYSRQELHCAAPVHVAHASSEIHEPTPCRATRSKILQWSPSMRSDGSGSIHVEVGRQKRRPPSEIAENARWMERVLASCENDIIPLTRGSSLLNSPMFRPNISPGISELPTQPDTMAFETSEASMMRSSSSLPMQRTSNISHPQENEDKSYRIASYQETNPNLHSGHGQRTEEPGKESVSECSMDAHRSNTKLSKTHIIAKESTEAYSQLEKWRHRTEEDDNDAWKRLIFGSSTDDVTDQVFKEAVNLTARELQPSSSVISTEEFLSPSYEGEEQMAEDPPSTLGDSTPRLTSVDRTSGCVEFSDTISASCQAADGSVSSGDVQMELPKTLAGGREMGASVIGTANDSDSLPSSALRSAEREHRSISPQLHSNQATKADSDNTDTIADRSSSIFTLPSLFVGKLAHPGAESLLMPLPPLKAPPLCNRSGKARGRGSRKRRPHEGRTDIRALPDFDGDPIEES
ncbi:uncharacterized protein JN550_001933 [Neoarthrinium moseri]|uniref:uncharacterized protein n=1 Tax=Neoarthrinium moseri TaxID=1658444 RepID=UPI001FDB6D20|nr:uncharacterized protein JN550_001933 [Neoarthrinium moseri]KAI1875647.1 hypothetical protein JN550_001933 [Neoarthrinium moseri]